MQLAYDSSGNLTSVTPPGRPAHGFNHTAIDLDSVYAPPSLGAGTWATEYDYTLDRQLTGLTAPGGIGQSFSCRFGASICVSASTAIVRIYDSLDTRPLP
ncbi:MAG: hypothetical protein ACREOC_11080 [Gemmatimonadales bacterium]